MLRAVGGGRNRGMYAREDTKVRICGESVRLAGVPLRTTSAPTLLAATLPA